MFPTTGGTLKHLDKNALKYYYYKLMTLTPARDSTFLLPVTLKRLIQERLPILLMSPGSQLIKNNSFSSSIETVLGYVSSSLPCYSTFSFFMFC